MLIPILMAATLNGEALLLECKVSPHGAAASDAVETIGAVLSFNPELFHVETRGVDFRTSTMGVGSTDDEWWWEDWRDGVIGRTHVNRTTLAYRVERGTQNLAGQCWEREEPVWPRREPRGSDRA